MTNESLRVFLAVDIREGDVKKKITHFQNILLQTKADLKLVESENIHITLRFLGETIKPLVEELKESLSEIRFQTFKIIFKGAGVFPNDRRINVVWVGIENGNVGLIDLCSKINRCLQKFRILPDGRGFSPHVTVARIRSGKNHNELLEAVKARANEKFGEFQADMFSLKQSTLTSTGPVYRDLQRITATKN